MSTTNHIPSNANHKNTVQDWVLLPQFHDVTNNIIKKGTLRDILKNRSRNGADHWCKKCGKNLILSPSRFYEWLEQRID